MRRSIVELLGWGRDVTRWHTMNSIKTQNIADHSWGVALLVMRLYHGPYKMCVLRAALEHDLAEKIVGDVPSPGRQKEHHDLEQNLADLYGIYYGGSLPDSCLEWLLAADRIDAGFFAMREIRLGNKNYEVVIDNLRKAFIAKPPPDELEAVAREAGIIL